ncbi:hypothetical protein LINPERPRIM_LOCUS18468 [Linum perenne]
MCTSISSDGDGGVGGGGESHQSVCMFSKKTKKQRVPKRGPGVAELEKILRREDHVPSSATVAAAVNLLPPPSPPATAATTTLFSIPSQHYSFSPQPMTWNPTESSRSSFQFPFSTLLGSNNGGLDHHQKQKQKQRNQQYSHFPTMMNFFPSSSSSSAGDGEPPSNQRFSRQFPDKQTMTGGKRHCPFAIDAVPEAPPFRFQVPSYLPQVEVVNTDSRGNLVLLGCPTNTHISKEQPMFYNPPLQQRSVESCSGSMSKPQFYSFLEEPGIMSKVETEFINGGGGEEEDGIDLRLKL